MAGKQPSFSIVDDDDDDDFDIDNMEDGDDILSPINIFSSTSGKKDLGDRTGNGIKDSESSDESNMNSPMKKFHDLENIDSLHPGPSLNGRKTVTKIRPPQLGQISSESDSEDSDGDHKNKGTLPGEYDPKMYEHLDVNEDIKDLFQYITKYVPQHLGQDYKFKPFIPDYLPAVGDIDAFLKVIPPEVNINGETAIVDQSELGLVVLDEPAANQSDPAVLHLQLRASNINMSHSTEMVIKKVDNLEKNSKTVDKWIKDISDLHRSKSSPILKYTDPMPDLDSLMEEWPENMENLLKIHGFPSYNLGGPLSRYIDIVCCLFDIPVYKNKMQSLHLLFSLYAAVKTSHLYRASNGGSSKTRNSASSNINDINSGADQLLLD